MILDARSRRLRFAPPQPLDTRISITADDLKIFSAISRHGPLPTTYLHAFLSGKNFNAFQYRLTKLYNGSQQTPPALVRPSQQFQSFHARYQHLVHDLSSFSKALLLNDGQAIVARTDGFVHRLMNACVGASIELACRSQGLLFIPCAEILARNQSTLALQHRGTTLVPDNLFGLRYADGSYRFFAVEVDRNTESIESGNRVSNSFGRKLRSYLDILTTKQFASHWGTPNLMVLVVTTGDRHKENLLHYLDRLTPTALKRCFLFKTKAEFGSNWKVPALMTDLLSELWRQGGSQEFDISTP